MGYLPMELYVTYSNGVREVNHDAINLSYLLHTPASTITRQSNLIQVDVDPPPSNLIQVVVDAPPSPLHQRFWIALFSGVGS